MTIKEYLGVPAERRAVCFSIMDSTSVVGPYHNEYVWFLRFDESGERITEITEFLDAQAAAQILGKLKEAGHG